MGLQDVGINTYFFEKISQAQVIKARNKQMGLYQAKKASVLQREWSINKAKRQLMEWTMKFKQPIDNMKKKMLRFSRY